MSAFIKGQMVVPKYKEYYPLMKGQLIINKIVECAQWDLYKCNDMVGTKYEFWEYELETQFQQDKRLGLLNKP